MKKAIAIAVCMLLIPFTAFSMEMVSDEEMDNVTGQSGVAITIDDVVIHNSGIDETWYQNEIVTAVDNSTGAISTGNAAAVGMVNPDNATESMMFVNALVNNPANSSDDQVGNYDQLGTYNELDTLYNRATDSGNYSHDASPLTIQVASAEDMNSQLNMLNETSGDNYSVLAAGNHSGAVAVHIGLPTVEIYNEGGDAMQLLVTKKPNPLGASRNDGNGTSSFGTLYTGGGSSTAILDGRIEITPVEEVIKN